MKEEKKEKYHSFSKGIAFFFFSRIIEKENKHTSSFPLFNSSFTFTSFFLKKDRKNKIKMSLDNIAFYIPVHGNYSQVEHTASFIQHSKNTSKIVYTIF